MIHCIPSGSPVAPNKLQSCHSESPACVEEFHAIKQGDPSLALRMTEGKCLHSGSK
jgi:hypothetical protein